MALIDSLPKVRFAPEAWVDGKKLMGKKLAELVRKYLKEETQAASVKPGLAVILVGEDAASQIYVASKEKAAQELGFTSVIVRLPAAAKQEEIVAKVHEFNHAANIHGILVQLPLPKHLNEKEILQAIIPAKDADGFHYVNQGKLLAGEETVLPCTPAGITLMLMQLGLNLTGKHAVVVGRSNIVGKPMAQLLLSALNMTVTTCHSKTQNLAALVRDADVLVSATGVRGVVDTKDIKPGAIVVDVGMHRIDGKLTGDLDLTPVAEKALYYTPVPGGVGPMTIAMLLYNTYHNALALARAKLMA
ncbi:MAG: bifunctional 5,10-methylenetetrahydrofolate dehydrogenase/5,10-methenyltetrahydrofolate cyclohydrolase [Turneriella sp.]|nr:bifunctional 5,10-methylenetetrahydrofolate dehydrogenase/5,10-methenyltetrahydrofolate cyclohydrolase [Turneriella sp.]